MSLGKISLLIAIYPNEQGRGSDCRGGVQSEGCKLFKKRTECKHMIMINLFRHIAKIMPYN